MFVGASAGRKATPPPDAQRKQREIVPAAPFPATLSEFAKIAWAADYLLYTISTGTGFAISRVPPDGGLPERIVALGGFPAATSDGRTVLFTKPLTSESP
jgi:hypothetical protein